MLRTLFVTGILAIGLTSGLVNRFAALLLYVWFALFRPIEWIWIDLSALRLSLVAGLVLVVPSAMTGVLPNVTHPVSIGVLVFAAAAGLAHIGCVAPDLSLSWLDYFARLALVCLLTVTLVDSRRRFVTLVAVMAGSFGFHAAKAGLASFIGGGVRFYDGLAGAFIDNNGYAVGGAIVAFLLVATAQNTPRRLFRTMWFAAAPLSAFMVISTFSRAGFVALVSGLLVFLLLQKHRVRSILAVSILLGIAWSLVPLPRGYLDRIDTIRTYDEIGEVSAISRPHFWRVAIDMVKDHPLGVGLWNFESNYNRYDFSDGEFGTSRSVHSSHFQVLAETGVIGTAAYLFLFAYSTVALLRIRSRSRAPDLPDDDARLLLTMANALLASTAAFLAGGAFVSMALNDLTWLIFALVAALDRLSLHMLETRVTSVPVPAPMSLFGESNPLPA